MSNTEKAAWHAAQAEEKLAKSEKGTAQQGAQRAAQATTHAVLALYFQREGE